MNNSVLICNLSDKSQIFHKRQSVIEFCKTTLQNLIAKIFSASAIVLFCDDPIIRLQKFLEICSFCKSKLGCKAKIVAVATLQSAKTSYLKKYFQDKLLVLQDSTQFENEIDKKLNLFFIKQELETFSQQNFLVQAEIAKRHLQFCTQKQLADNLKIARSTLANIVRLSNLSQQTKRLFAEEKISNGHARCLANLNEKQQNYFAQQIVQQKLSVRQAEKLKKVFVENSSHSSNQSACAEKEGINFD